MRPIIYEIRRTLTSRFVILMMVAIIGLSSLLAYESAASYNSSQTPFNQPSLSYGYYNSGGNVTLVTYSYNIYGQPYSNLTIGVTSQSGSTYTLLSGDHGFANITMPYNPLSTVPVTLNYTFQIFGISTTHPGQSLYMPGQYSGYKVIHAIFSRTNSSNLGFQVLYVGPGGATAPETSFYVSPLPSSGMGTDVVENATYTRIAGGFTVSNIFPTIPQGKLNLTYALAMESNGTLVTPSLSPSSALLLGRLSTYTPMTQSKLQNLVFTGISTILNYLLPILGVFAAYLTYGKDRTTGVLESVLKRPVTRHGLITSRFLANTVSIVIAVIASMFIADLIIMHYFIIGLTWHFMLFFIWTYVVEGLAFLAMIYMFSHLVKSQGSLLGISIAIFVIMALFWAIIPVVVLLALSISPASSTYITASVAFNYASPSGYSSLVQFLFEGHMGILGATANPASYGVTQPLLIIAGILWVGIPFGIAYALAGRYD